MFLHNTYQWPWTRIAALVAPRPMLFANSDQDPIFPMDANERAINRLERVYSLYGRSDWVDAAVSIGGHAYRKDLRQAAYRFLNLHLLNDGRVVEDSERDLIEGERDRQRYPIPIDRLRVFPSESDLPKDEINTRIDEFFVALARPKLPQPGEVEVWRDRLKSELKRRPFRALPERVVAARPVGGDLGAVGRLELETEPGIRIPLVRGEAPPAAGGQKVRIVLGVSGGEPEGALTALMRRAVRDGDHAYVVQPRGIGDTRWTRRNPPNYVERSHVLIGQTVDTGRVRDVMATARYLREAHGGTLEVAVVAEGPAAVWAAYAALWEPEIDALTLRNPAVSHMETGAPQFLSVLRICDVPEVLGLLAPRSVVLEAAPNAAWDRTASVYAAANAADRFRRVAPDSRP
jgi:hypothetical protein